jgi:hypothetical protein
MSSDVEQIASLTTQAQSIFALRLNGECLAVAVGATDD